MLHKHINVNGYNVIVVDLETIMYRNAKPDNFRHIGDDYFIVPGNLNIHDYASIAGFTIDTSLPQGWFDEHKYDRGDYVWYYEKGSLFGEPMLKEQVLQAAYAVILAHLKLLLQEKSEVTKS